MGSCFSNTNEPDTNEIDILANTSDVFKIKYKIVLKLCRKQSNLGYTSCRIFNKELKYEFIPDAFVDFCKKALAKENITCTVYHTHMDINWEQRQIKEPVTVEEGVFVETVVEKT